MAGRIQWEEMIDGPDGDMLVRRSEANDKLYRIGGAIDSLERPAVHFGSRCSCDERGEDPQCPSHGYEAVIRRYVAWEHRILDTWDDISSEKW